MSESQCLIRIQSAYPHLSEKEKKIADYILSHPEETVRSSINQLSAQIDVADATVFRFCRRLSFKGFQEMKIVLAADIARQQTAKAVNGKYAGDDVMELAEHVFFDNIRTLENTFQILHADQFRKAVSILSTAARIAIFSSSGSAMIAQEAHRKFIRAGLSAFAPGDGEFQLLAAQGMRSQDAAIFLSYSASDKRLLQIAKLLKAKNCSIIGLTGFMKSALSETMDISLHTVSLQTDYRSESYVARAVQMTLLDALFVNVLHQKSMRSVAEKDLVQAGQ
ncbi:MAG: MurR/RpiR family transcriptional regulator [Sporolactobacillus sp.]